MLFRLPIRYTFGLATSLCPYVALADSKDFGVSMGVFCTSLVALGSFIIWMAHDRMTIESRLVRAEELERRLECIERKVDRLLTRDQTHYEEGSGR